MSDWLEFFGLCLGCVTAYLMYLTKIQSSSTHDMVNSKFDKLVRENAAYAARIAQLTGTADDSTRADVASERARE